VWPWLEDRKILSCYASLKVLCRTAGVPYHPFHSIRKSTASYLKKAGISAKKQLGHSSEEMAENHYYDDRITGVESALDFLPPLDLTGPRDNAAAAATDFLSQLPGQFPAGLQQVVGEVSQRVGAALPTIFGAIPDTLQYQTSDTVFRPAITAAMPLYTGGAIPAIQAGADGAVEVARARRAGGRDLSRVGLVRAYFGQQVAAQLTRSTHETLAGFDRHLLDAVKLEQNGVIPHARVLQVQVARDAAERAFIRAQLEEATAADALSRLLDRPAGVSASTPLFVNSQPLPPVSTFLEGIDATPRARGADAARDIASAGVGLAKSRYRPQAFAFGSYNANRDKMTSAANLKVGTTLTIPQ
jgi:outer membrane protein TolC